MGLARTLREKGLGWLDQNERIRNAAVAAWASTLPAGAAILDAGAGTGHYAPLFKHCRYTASDHPDASYAPTDFPLVRGDITAIPLPDASQDAILCTEVLEHIEDPLAALVEFARLLKPGGELFLSVPAACRVHRVTFHYWGGFAPDFFEKALPARGFTLSKLEPVGNCSTWMAQEVGRFPSLLRDHTALPKPVGALAGALSWPVFRIGVPALLLAFSTLDTSDDLPVGWLARARRIAS